MAQRTTLVVLAAGEGTRMKSALPKVLHRIAEKPMIGHAVAAARMAGADRIAVVVGPGRDDVAAAARKASGGAEIFVQKERLGTAHAVLAAKDAFAKGENLLVVFGDTPLLRPETLRAMREEKDATETERAVNLCNAGAMAFAGKHALSLLSAIGNRNSKQEFYLTDAVELANARGLSASVIEASEEEVMGVNDRKQLSEAEAVLQKRLREAAMEAGVTLVAPETVFLSSDTKFGRDVTVEPNVVFGPGVTIGDNVTIRSFS